jgi:OHCU decarboxylase
LKDISKPVEWLNSLSADEAETELLKCCGSKRWAREMTAARPYASAEDLTARAEELWLSLNHDDWLEAFRAHPKIGEQKSAVPQSEQAHNWSVLEQSGVKDARAEIKAALAQGNREYEERFGFIYIVCATGKTSEEMLTLLNKRLRNDRATELQMAAREQQKITRLRLEKLLTQ